jgi:hypothetical protein
VALTPAERRRRTVRSASSAGGAAITVAASTVPGRVSRTTNAGWRGWLQLSELLGEYCQAQRPPDQLRPAASAVAGQHASTSSRRRDRAGARPTAWADRRAGKRAGTSEVVKVGTASPRTGGSSPRQSWPPRRPSRVGARFRRRPANRLGSGGGPGGWRAAPACAGRTAAVTIRGGALGVAVADVRSIMGSRATDEQGETEQRSRRARTCIRARIQAAAIMQLTRPVVRFGHHPLDWQWQ